MAFFKQKEKEKKKKRKKRKKIKKILVLVSPCLLCTDWKSNCFSGDPALILWVREKKVEMEKQLDGQRSLEDCIYQTAYLFWTTGLHLEHYVRKNSFLSLLSNYISGACCFLPPC